MGGWNQEILRFVTMFEKGPDKIENIFRKMFDMDDSNVNPNDPGNNA